jgi:hypothetical protein
MALTPAAHHGGRGFLDAFIQNYSYWIFGQLTDDMTKTARQAPPPPAPHHHPPPPLGAKRWNSV